MTIGRALCLLLVCCPSGAVAQQSAFVERLDALIAVTPGTYGDEGAQIGAVLEGMGRALAAWERGPESPEGGGEVSAPHAVAGTPPPGEAVTAYLALTAGTGAGAGGGGPAAALDVLGRACARLGAQDGSPIARRPFPSAGLLGADAPAPVLPLAAYTEGYALVEAGRYEAALAALRRGAAGDALVTDPAQGLEPFALGVAALREGRLAAARTHLLAALEEAPGSSEAHRVLGLVYWAASRTEEALGHLDRAIEAGPGDERARVTRARVLMDAGRFEEARATLQAAVAAFPDSALAHWWLGWVHENLREVPEARRHLELAAARGLLAGHARLHGAIGRLARTEGDFDGALAAFDRAVRGDLNDARAHRELAQAYLEHDRLDDALRELLAACLIEPRDAGVHAGIGRLLLDSGRPRGAVDALRRAVALAPGEHEMRYALATALTRVGDAEGAARELERFERASREALDVRRRDMALDVLIEEATLRTDEGWHDRAAVLWQQVVARQPDRPSHHANLAAALAGAGRPHEAIPAYERAVALGAEPDVFRRLADLYALAGRAADSARAAAAYDRARGAPSAEGSTR